MSRQQGSTGCSELAPESMRSVDRARLAPRSLERFTSLGPMPIPIRRAASDAGPRATPQRDRERMAPKLPPMTPKKLDKPAAPAI